MSPPNFTGCKHPMLKEELRPGCLELHVKSCVAALFSWFQTMFDWTFRGVLVVVIGLKLWRLRAAKKVKARRVTQKSQSFSKLHRLLSFESFYSLKTSMNRS